MITIRKFRPADRAVIRKICMDTGKKSFQKSAKKREFIALMFIDYYLDYEPENVFVADDDGVACGYIVCSTNKQLFKEKMKQVYLPKIRKISLILAIFTRFCIRTSWRLDQQLGGGGFHINIDAAHQGQKIGPRLLTALGQHLAAAGHPYMYLITANRKTRGYGFYRHYGFTEVAKCPGGSLALAFDLSKIDTKKESV